MKNKYTPVSDSDESFKTLIDEKVDTHSSDGTPPPYSASNKFIDLEMADGSAQNSAELSGNNIRSDPSPNKQRWKTPVIGTVTIITIIYNIVFIAIVFGYKVSPYSKTFYGLAGSSIGSICTSLLAILYIYPEWYRQAGINMCVAVICTASLNVAGFVVYFNVKKIIGFEKMNDIAFYGVCIVNAAVFVLFWRYPDARQLRVFIADLGNGMLNSIKNAADYVRPTDPENEAPRNEEIELQPFAGQSAEV
ncbi:uncharacterized protein SOCG_04742 [Schizosaccharomyces octosporus yFS286]|uniref:Uncharacterized protein n=1 Tax=Schizosaccharomyces octosporus (strain yFS286) TaxID=483514 RepID=S9R8P8_SCHOY|nr:uncharacterized protein SOCG_04742 [Schizosaccharomyces octosporus yFS286]EPX70464.1 hypothetical protein SOCG_04742 [Schizosaccharomyces octosporus yFS286]